MGDGRAGGAAGGRGRPVSTVTILVPTRDEEENVPELVGRLDAALGEVRAEVLFVDDSTDGTPERIRSAAATSRRPVRLLHRTPEERVGGLGGAVVAGLSRARTEWVVVMDADLQHPPEVVPSLLAAAGTGMADVVVASRYCGDGSAAGLSSRFRAWVSSTAATLARLAFPRSLAGCSDPMSGFFAVRRSALDVDRLRPIGFKILLEILVRTPGLRVAELPFAFARRVSGESKASLIECVRLARQMLRLRLATAGGRPGQARLAAARMLGFGLVGITGITVNTAALWLPVSGFGTHYLLGAALAAQVSTAWNFALADAVVFRGRKRGKWAGRFVPFALVNNAALPFRLPLLALLVTKLHMGYVIGNVSALLLPFLARFATTNRFIHRTGRLMTATPGGDGPAHCQPVDLVIDVSEAVPARAAAGPGARAGAPATRALPRHLPHRYDVHGLVRIGSEVPLVELEYFRAPLLRSGYDIEVRRGQIGTGRPRRRALVTQTASPPGVRYEEHLGRRGADVEVRMGEPVEIVAGPMLTRSPHVLYANVVEAILRFLLVSRGHLLLHSACLEMDGVGVMISARTDTGKTGTVLRLLRDCEARFLSDDMTVVAPDGTALAYPKPLTISRHTLRAVDAGALTRGERRRLWLQSWLHSRAGRAIGIRLGEMNLPIMAMNALAQRLVPPPKYAVGRLLPCQVTGSARIDELFVIERGPASVDDIKPIDLSDLLIENTDDAYGFPPFHYLVPALVIGEDSYEQLRAKERSILEAAMSRVRARRLATDDYGWADEIRGLLAEPHADRDVEPAPGSRHGLLRPVAYGRVDLGTDAARHART